MRTNDLAYAAGFFDGEGSVSILKKGTRKDGLYYLGLVIQATGQSGDVINWLATAFGGRVYLDTPANRDNKYYHWIISGQPAAQFLGLLLPYLKIKQRQAELAITFQALKLPKIGSRGKLRGYKEQVELREQVLLLNRRT